MVSPQSTQPPVKNAEPIVSTVLKHGAGPWIVGRLVLADDAAEKDQDTAALLRLALGALRAESASAMYLTTPAGFYRGNVSATPNGTRGWRTRQADFDALADVAIEIAMDISRDADAGGGPVHYLSLGIDLCREGRPGGHSETSVLYDTRTEKVIGVTGKSYPTGDQQDDLIRNGLSATHLIRVDGNPAVVLVCHDLSMYNPRGRAVRRAFRAEVANELEEAISEHHPTLALHQAHTVESARTWTNAWNAFSREHNASLTGWTTAFRYRTKDDCRPAEALSLDVLRRTRGGSLPAIDIVLSNAKTAHQLT